MLAVVRHACNAQIGCDHEWEPADVMIAWRCKHCLRERDGMPKDGPDVWARIARWLMRALFVRA
jgi:hypothetical protein